MFFRLLFDVLVEKGFPLLGLILGNVLIDNVSPIPGRRVRHMQEMQPGCVFLGQVESVAEAILASSEKSVQNRMFL